MIQQFPYKAESMEVVGRNTCVESWSKKPVPAMDTIFNLVKGLGYCYIFIVSLSPATLIDTVDFWAQRENVRVILALEKKIKFPEGVCEK